MEKQTPIQIITDGHSDDITPSPSTTFFFSLPLAPTLRIIRLRRFELRVCVSMLLPWIVHSFALSCFFLGFLFGNGWMDWTERVGK